MADIKALLKEARKLIDENNYKEAQECCKNILRKDKQNYLALVLLGKSLQDTEQAPLAYQKAIAVKSDSPLAWQGLASYYEKKDDAESRNKLLIIYNDMLQLKLEDDKIFELLGKIGQLGATLKNNHSISILSQFILKVPNDIKLKDVAEKQILSLLNTGIICKEEDIISVLKLLQESYERQHTSYSETLELTIAKVILQKTDFVSAVQEVINLNYFAKNSTVREFLCDILCQKYLDDNSFGGLDIETCIGTITKGIEHANAATLVKSMLLYDQAKYADAYKLCIPLINYSQPNNTTVMFIIQCTIKLKMWSVTEKLITNFLLKIKDPVIVEKLKKFLFTSLNKQQKWSQAERVAKELPVDSLSSQDRANLAECLIHLYNDADSIMKTLEGSVNYVQLKSLQFLKQGKYSEVVSLIEERQIEDPIILLHLGKAYWELKAYDKSQLNLLKSAKLNPENSETFLYLGHFYRYHVKDLEKAKKCYEKAYNLNCNDSIVVKNLSEIYSIVKHTEKDFDLLSLANKNHGINEAWINFRLGLHYLNKREWESAIFQFRSVIKKEHSNATAFECLADAYFSRGSYTSALRAYAKVITLDEKRINHCQTRMGYIYSILTQFNESISTFETVLLNDPDSLLALKGISETWMRVAQKKYDAKLFGSARDSAQQAVNYVMKALSKHKQYNCIWKMLGDALIFVTKLPETYAFVTMKSLLKSDGDVIAKIVKLDIFPQAIACYARIAKAKQQPATYDLASTYFHYYVVSNNVAHLNIAFNLTTACIREKPSVWRNWNLLGRLSLNINKFNISQHCFIKALQATRKWSVAKIWCNLGMLYVKLKLYKVANYCFWRGQSTLPSYSHSWIGQALIAEAIREEEAMDLFRHASRLGYHRESALGYADWVCRTLKNNLSNDKRSTEFNYVIEGLHATSYAIDLIEWFSCYEPKDACARNIVGVLQERCGLLQAALKSYGTALVFVKDENKNIVYLNLARIHLRLGLNDEAVKYYKSITEASLDSACGLALALYKNGLYEESYSTYDTALQWLCNDEIEKADLLVAMSGIVYMFKGMADAKTLLFHSIQISQAKLTAHSLYAICSLGLLHSDQSLSKLALRELRKYEKDSACSFDIGFLKSFIKICENSVQQAIKVLSEALHDHPNNALLWFCMAQYCLQMADTKARVASCCAQKALCSEYEKDNDWSPAKMLATASIAEHISGDKNKAFILAKKGLHLYPHQAEIWAALLLSLLSCNDFVKLRNWIRSAASHMRKNLTISRPLVHWAGLIEKKISSC